MATYEKADAARAALKLTLTDDSVRSKINDILVITDESAGEDEYMLQVQIHGKVPVGSIPNESLGVKVDVYRIGA